MCRSSSVESTGDVRRGMARVRLGAVKWRPGMKLCVIVKF
jgi:hypothetical protein